MRALRYTAVAALVPLALTACSGSRQTVAPAEEPAAGSSAPKAVEKTLAEVGLDAAALDRSVSPCEDFYQFACGGWLASTEIPADKSRWGRGFSEVQERNEKVLREILDEARQGSEDPDLARLGTYYGACMDEESIEKAGLAPLAELLASARAVKDSKSLQAAVRQLHSHGVWVLFDISAMQDFKNATEVIAYLDQNGLGLPDRDYYFRDDEKSESIRKAYQEHVERMLVLAGLPQKQAKKAVGDVMAIESGLAKVSKTRVERRDPEALYNKVDRAGVAKLAPKFDWNAYFTSLGIPQVQDIVVTSVPFFEGVEKLMGSVKPEQWRNYLQWHVVRAYAGSLPKAFVDESFRMSKVLTGQEEIEPRWKRCVASTDRALGEILAQPWVERRFGGESKAATEQMVLEISKAFGRELRELEWMDDDTRARAFEKLDAVAYQIGYPRKWKSYEWEVSGRHAGNVLSSRAYELRRSLSKIGQPLDPDEWYMTPPTVNAYYSPLRNQMVFPAGILQPPFYNPEANVAVNLGGMGMVVGHELTHGFDDKGSQFAADGNLKNWWGPEVGEAFQQKTQCVAEQYSKYEVQPGVFLNGELTLGENIADIGGVKMAFRAYRALREGAPEVVVADGFTEDQQFFLSVGQAWCTKAREEMERMQAQMGPHSLPRFRVNGSLSNQPEFAEAFSCEAGTPMRPKNACEVW